MIRKVPTKMLVYFYYNKPEQCYALKISKKLDITNGHTFKVLEKLENNGLIMEVPNKVDKRRIYYKLTEKGRSITFHLIELKEFFDEYDKKNGEDIL